jgi:NAD-reducing hydrogenase small subunit
MSLLDLDERLLEIAKLADIVKSPLVDAKEFPECDVALVEGGITNADQVHEIQVIRQRTRFLVAFGDCAVTGNVLELRMRFSKEECLARSYIEAQSNVAGRIPADPDLARLIERWGPLHEHVRVDYFLPGCPPSPDLIFHVVSELLQDRTPDLDLGGKAHYG